MTTDQKVRRVGGRFRVIKTLGSGGMGDVYLAQDEKLPRKVAIKSIRPDLSKNAEVRKRLARESQLHAKIGSHQHIVTLYDQLEEEGQIHLVMEFVEGECLQDVLERYARQQRGLQLQDAVVLVDQTLQALACIHQHGIVHRDIKPGNLLLTKNDGEGSRAKLMDFGIARQEVEEAGATMLTQENTSSPGTPLYMAPEQIDPMTFGQVTAATDLYAVGIMFYQMLAGAPPFQGSLTQIYSGHLSQQPPEIVVTGNDSIGDEFKAVLRRALAKQPSERFASATEFRTALANASAGLASAANVSVSIESPAQQAADPNRTLLADERTLLAHEAQQTAFNPGQTVLSGTATGHKGGSVAKIAIAVAAALLIIAAAAAAGYYALNRPSDTSPQEALVEHVEPAVPATVPAPPPDEPWANESFDDNTAGSEPMTSTERPDGSALDEFRNNRPEPLTQRTPPPVVEPEPEPEPEPELEPEPEPVEPDDNGGFLVKNRDRKKISN